MTLAQQLDGVSQPLPSARAVTENELISTHFVYARENTPAWTNAVTLLDVEDHLVVISVFQSFVALFASDPGFREAARGELSDSVDPVLMVFEGIPASRLNATFVKGQARTLWLSGTHRRTSLKADNKVLSGINLKDALDPLGDQSYVFTAARCATQMARGRASYGVAPRKSALWFSPSRNWAEYRDTVREVLQLIALCTLDEDAPLPVLATPMTHAVDLAALGAAYELSLVSAETLDPVDGDGDPQGEELPELQFEVVLSTVPDIVVDVASADGGPLGRCRLTLQLADPTHVQWSVLAEPGGAGITDESLELVRENRRRIKASFDGGFAVSGSALYAVRYRDMPFESFRWANFDGFNIHREKPNPLNAAQIGQQDSLFCWIRSKWGAGTLDWLPQQGWLACNDGALEIADFIHLDEASRTLTLIHVKAAKDAVPGRGLRVAPFEIVVSQAIKNLRHVDAQIVAGEFTNRLNEQLLDAVWHAGVGANRVAMLAAINAGGSSWNRRVVILQPDTRRQARDLALGAAEGTKERHLVRQLHGLLLGAQRDCSGLGAEFFVVAHDA